MSEAGGSILAITEKKAQRASGGGCVGIFFQLFDWNRKFAKKKLFSNKLLPLGQYSMISYICPFVCFQVLVFKLLFWK